MDFNSEWCLQLVVACRTEGHEGPHEPSQMVASGVLATEGLDLVLCAGKVLTPLSYVGDEGEAVVMEEAFTGLSREIWDGTWSLSIVTRLERYLTRTIMVGLDRGNLVNVPLLVNMHARMVLPRSLESMDTPLRGGFDRVDHVVAAAGFVGIWCACRILGNSRWSYRPSGRDKGESQIGKIILLVIACANKDHGARSCRVRLKCGGDGSGRIGEIFPWI
ncbi:hypothetical protein NE237_000656 [Protea cynaroides]|uniref:Uncharacterized protein n=1 Tax=Protea cynaroides TaxID=273540 RepID=A0A9Q0QXC5_9MAGN|nr:hypothetical protein NE237_000656 [Protea cynaroides]